MRHGEAIAQMRRQKPTLLGPIIALLCEQNPEMRAIVAQHQAAQVDRPGSAVTCKLRPFMRSGGCRHQQ